MNRTHPQVDELTRRNVETITRIEKASNDIRTPGERAADAFAGAVGSWPFIIAQTVLLTFWITMNVVAWMNHWDPYPFILLNLALSFQAAYASPIIMMSQNRQARISDRRNQLDLQINLLAEQESTEMLRMLRMLCNKLDIHLENYSEALEQVTTPEKLVEQIEEATKDAQDDASEGSHPEEQVDK